MFTKRQLPQCLETVPGAGALPAPDGIRPELSEAYVAPRTEVEQTIAAIWQELLGIDKVGSHDNFFDLGGHSLLMVQANSELRIAFERDISTIDMFKYPTVNSLAEYLTKDQDEPGSLQQSKTRAETRREFMKRRKKLQGLLMLTGMDLFPVVVEQLLY